MSIDEIEKDAYEIQYEHGFIADFEAHFQLTFKNQLIM